MKITGMSIVHVLPRWSILTITTDEGIEGYGEAIVEGRSRTVAMAVKEFEQLLIGQDPRRIEHLWQMMYRGTFYRGGPVLTSAISGIEQALWDILGKWLGVPVYQLLGGHVRDKIRMYAHAGSVEKAKAMVSQGFTCIKAGIDGKSRGLEPPQFIMKQVERLAALRDAVGWGVDIAIDFHGKIPPPVSIQLIKELEFIKPMFIEEPCLPENVDELARIARMTTVPIATGERLYTRFGFREVLEKQAAVVLQPDLAHCGGIMEAKKIAAMGEAYYASLAPHNPLGPVNLAASLQLDANAPNFLVQEHVAAALEPGILKQPFVISDGCISLPKGPGLGIELDKEGIAARAYEGTWDTPRWLHDDGSVADW